MVILNWNIDGFNQQEDLLQLLVEEFGVHIFILQESKVRISEIFGTSNKWQDWNIEFLLEEHVAKTFEERTRLHQRSCQYGLTVATRKNIGVDVKFMNKIDNSHFSFLIDNILFSNIYLPQQGFPNSILNTAISKWSTTIENAPKFNYFWSAGDFNTSFEKSNNGRKKIIEDHMEKYRLTRTAPNIPSNYTANGNTIIDYAIHSPELRTTVTPLTNEDYPLNTSTHIPLLFEVEYEQDQKSTRCDISYVFPDFPVFPDILMFPDFPVLPDFLDFKVFLNSQISKCSLILLDFTRFY